VVAEGSIFVEELGHGPAVVLLHGQPGTAEHVAPVRDLLVGDARVLSIDRPGYGRTTRPPSPPSVQAVELLDLLADVGATPAIVVAHSYAAAVAILMAVEDPAAVAGLVLVAGVGGVGSVAWIDTVLASRWLGAATSTMSLAAYGIVAPVLARLKVGRSLEGNVPMVPTTWLLEQRRTFLDEQRFLVAEEPLVEAARASVACRALVLQGTADDLVPLRAGHDLAAALPDAELIELEGAGHLLPRDEPAAIADAVRRLCR
jgi:pimeloyl-ACP methyl ester carboxylesterase